MGIVIMGEISRRLMIKKILLCLIFMAVVLAALNASFAEDLNLNNQSNINNQTNTIDTTAPTASASPSGGLYNKTLNITLIALDNMDPNPLIYYTTNGSDPSILSTRYSAPIGIGEGTTLLKFMALDDAGNPSMICNETYHIQSNATIDQIKAAATTVKTYIETYFKPPATVQIGFIDVNMAQFLELLMTATLQIMNGNSSSIPFKNFTLPVNPVDDVGYGNVLKVEYLKMANDLMTYMDTTGRTPDYQYRTSIGTHLGFHNLVYMYSNVLHVYSVANYMPNFVEMKPWSSIAGRSAGIIADGPLFTLDQLKNTSIFIKNYVESYNKLPDNITLNGTSLNMAQFLELIMTATLQISGGNSNPIPLRNFTNPTNPVDNLRAGNMGMAEYLKIAHDLKNYMDTTGRSPDYQYGTSLGTHLGFQNLIYMYSKIMYVNKVAGYLPGFVEMRPWSSYTSLSVGIIPSGPMFTLDQIKGAALTVKNTVETSNTLPDNVTINGTSMNMAQFLELLMTTTLQISGGNNNPIPLRNYSLPKNSVDHIISGDISKAEYLKIATDLKNYMDSIGRSPDYQYGTSLGTHLGFHNLVYMYSKILDSNLPDYISIDPWKLVSNPALAYFNISQIQDAALTLKNYVEIYYRLPDNVTINGTSLNMAQFLELLMGSVIQLTGGKSGPVALRNYTNPTNPIDDIRAGNIFKAEYIKIANDLKNYMDSTGKTPDYQYGITMGTHLGFQNLVYMYSKILYVYKVVNYLPNFVEMKPWSSITGGSSGIIPGGPLFSIDQIRGAASTVKSYIDLNSKLPENTIINGTTVNMAQYLELLMTATIQMNGGNNNSIPLRAFNNPNNPIDDINPGNILKAEYLKIANDLKTYMDSTGRSPDYGYGTTLGTHLGFGNLIYMYSKVIDSYGGKLADSVSMESWRYINSPTLAVFNISQIMDAAVSVKSYIDNNKKLPQNVTIDGTMIKMPQFLEVLMSVTLQLSGGKNELVLLKNYGEPADPIDSIRAGNILRGEYLKIATDLRNYMHSTGKTPDYQYQVSLGMYLGFQNLIYMYTKVLNFYKAASYLPDFVEMKLWKRTSYGNYVIGSTSYGYVDKGFYGNMNAAQTVVIIVGVHPLENGIHSAIITALANRNSGLNKRFVIYKVHVTQNPYDYNIGRMNGQLLAQQFIVPEVSGEEPMVVMDIHENKYTASGYAYPRFLYPISGSGATIGYANQIIGRMPFLLVYSPPNPTSPQYVTIPIANQGITTLIYETYLYDSGDKKLSDAYAFIDALDLLY